MKIALINSLYKPYKRGGAEVVFTNIAQELKKDNHEVFIITISKYKKKTKFFEKYIEGIKVYRFYPKNIFSFIDINQQPVWKRIIWHLVDTFNFHSYKQVKKILKKEKPDLVLSHNLKGLGYLTLKAVKKLNIRNIHTLHDVQLVNLSGLIIKGKEKQNFVYRLYGRITRWLFASPELVVAPSKWLLDFYASYGFFPRSRKRVLENPLILEDDNFDKDLDSKFIIYLFLGQLEKHKGIIFLLNTFKKFAQDKKVKLVVVGDGSLRAVLEKKFKTYKWLNFLGYVPQSELGEKVFKTVNYTIVPSLCYENSPGVIYESYKYQTPVIGAEIGGISELIQEGVTGYTFAAGDPISLLNKLNQSYQLKHFKQLSENAKIKAKEYNIKDYVYKILSL